MNDDIRRLVGLQELAVQMKELEEAQEALPARVAQLDQEFQRRVEEIGAARLRHEALAQQQQRLNLEREDVQNRLRQAQQKLMSVNNQREYSAVLNEIDTLKLALSEREDKLLAGETELEQLAGPVAEADVRISEERARTDAAKSALKDQMSQAVEQLVGLRRQREELSRGIAPDLYRRFESVFRARGGIAVARVVKDSCGACHVRLRPQIIHLAKRGQGIVTCESCRRILYAEEGEQGTDAAVPESPPPVGVQRADGLTGAE